MSRPIADWNGFMGQGRVVRAIATMTAGARALGKLLPHLIFLGNSGLGKSALARATADAYGSTLHVIIGRKDLEREDIDTVIESSDHGDVIFIDEVQSVRCAVQEQLYGHMDYALSVQRTELQTAGNPQSAEKKDSRKALSFIAATDCPGDLQSAFKKRFCHTVELRPYSPREMTAILRLRAQSHNLLLTPQASRLLAQTCRGIPRLAEHRVVCLTVHLGEASHQEVDAPKASRFLRAMGIDKIGLGDSDRNYLEALVERTGEGASPIFLAAKIHRDLNFVLRDVEPFLLQCGLIDITKRGRVITPKGTEHMRGKTGHEDAKNHGQVGA